MKCPARDNRFPGDDIDIRYMSREVLAKLVCRHQLERNEFKRALCQKAYDNWVPVPDFVAALPDDHPVRQRFEEASDYDDTFTRAMRFEMEDKGDGRFRVAFFDEAGLQFFTAEWSPERPYPPKPPSVPIRAIFLDD